MSVLAIATPLQRLSQRLRFNRPFEVLGMLRRTMQRFGGGLLIAVPRATEPGIPPQARDGGSLLGCVVTGQVRQFGFGRLRQLREQPRRRFVAAEECQLCRLANFLLERFVAGNRHKIVTASQDVRDLGVSIEFDQFHENVFSVLVVRQPHRETKVLPVSQRAANRSHELGD